MEDCSTIFDDLDTPICSSITYDETLAQEFEPLDKGTTPVGVVRGNMVCSDMRIVCAFDSDKVGVSFLVDWIEWSEDYGRSYFLIVEYQRNCSGRYKPHECKYFLFVRWPRRK